MSSTRIDYIDYLKGLSIIWVVWYHTVHPWFVDFSFRIPLFFFASGIFFKVVDWKTYIQKKTNQLIIPFIFFTLIYYLYLICQYYISQGSLETFNWNCIWGVFELHSSTNSFKVDPPLWFICALICQQIITWLLVRLLQKKQLIFLITLGICIIGNLYIYDMPTPFMFGRSLPYLIYYIAGNLYGKDLLKIIESPKSTISYSPLIGATCIFCLSMTLKQITVINETLLTYFETFSLIIILIYLFKGIYKFKIAYPFWFFGRNSYIVLGLHEIYQTIFMIMFLHLYGEINIWIGILQTSLTLLFLWPTINVLNRKLPMLVGKGVLINFHQLKHSLKEFTHRLNFC